MDFQTILLFSTACFVLAVTPGPDMILVAARSAAQGRLAGYITQLGISAGSMCHAVILALGLSKLFLALPYAYDLVRYLGAAYLLYLAWQSLTSHNNYSTNTSTTNRLSMSVTFRQGFVSNILNPKVALFYLALFPQFLDPAKGAVGLQIMTLSVIFVAIDLAVHAVVIWMAGGVRSLSTSRLAFSNWSRYFLSLVFGGLAARLIFDGQ